MTAAEMSREFGIPAASIRQWIRRGYVRRHACGSVDLVSLVDHLNRGKDMTAHWFIDKIN